MPMCYPSEFIGGTSHPSPRWYIDGRPDTREPLPNHLNRRDQIGIATHEHLPLTALPIRIVEHVNGDVHVRALFLGNGEDARTASAVDATRAGTGDLLPLETPVNYLNQRQHREGAKQRILAPATGTGFDYRGEVLDRLDVVVWAQEPKEALKV